MGDGLRAKPATLYAEHSPADVMHSYLAEIPVMVRGSDSFAVFTHLDYAARTWPNDAGPFDPRAFEDEIREAMRAIAQSDRALEMNTRRLWSWMPEWWRDEGGRAVTFGSDAHTPDALARGFPEAVAMLEHYGFRSGRHPWGAWTR
jgi:histidinol-phosphatase (PHP family)